MEPNCETNGHLFMSAQRCIICGAPEPMSMVEGTFECPVCGEAQPHHHTPDAVRRWERLKKERDTLRAAVEQVVKRTPFVASATGITLKMPFATIRQLQEAMALTAGDREGEPT